MIAPAASAACREHDAPQLVGGELRLRLYTHGSRVKQGHKGRPLRASEGVGPQTPAARKTRHQKARSTRYPEGILEAAG